MILVAIFNWKQKTNKNSQRITDESAQCGRETKAGAEELKAQEEEFRAGRKTTLHASETKRKWQKRKGKEAAASSTRFQLRKGEDFGYRGDDKGDGDEGALPLNNRRRQRK